MGLVPVDRRSSSAGQDEVCGWKRMNELKKYN